MNLDLSNKNALVGGSSAGIGKTVAIELAALGANVILLARNEAKLEHVYALLDTSKGQKHRYIIADYTDSAALSLKVNAFATQHPIHILINNTGGPPSGPISEASTEAFYSAFHNHLICNHLLAQAVLPGMKNAGFGRIINIISTSVKEPLENLGVSNTTRGAVASWAKTLAGEVGKYGITVNNVLPGYTGTGRLDEIIEKRATALQQSREKIIEQFEQHVPLRRFAEPEEIAAAVAFLASPAAGYISGINLPVDGGRTKSL